MRLRKLTIKAAGQLLTKDGHMASINRMISRQDQDPVKDLVKDQYLDLAQDIQRLHKELLYKQLHHNRRLTGNDQV